MLFFPISGATFIAVIIGCPNVASITPGLRGGKIGIRHQEEQGHPVLQEKPIDEENGAVRSIHRRYEDAARNHVEELKLATACFDARDKVRSRTEQNIDDLNGSGLQELLLAAEMACNTWFAWTDDMVPDVDNVLQ
ncbi:hypothetical protein ACHAW5_001317 [Stephanodiscus triporus]|uniref:Uncharacterized protein n=1 Tax=Stephanodiscus triporus TaxID=2934178 RepID=A0ABD3MYC6_9STRA